MNMNIKSTPNLVNGKFAIDYTDFSANRYAKITNGGIQSRTSGIMSMSLNQPQRTFTSVLKNRPDIIKTGYVSRGALKQMKMQ